STSQSAATVLGDVNFRARIQRPSGFTLFPYTTLFRSNSRRKKVYYAWSKGRILSTSGKGSLMDLSIQAAGAENACPLEMEAPNIDRKSTRLNSSHVKISYAVFCLKKKRNSISRRHGNL